MSERAHAKLSASGAKRWMACPKSVALEEMTPEETSEFAEEGTKAHELGEKVLSRIIYGTKMPPQEDPTMEHYVGMYVDACIESYEAEKLNHPDAIALIEQKVDFSNWVPGGFGTCDFMVIAGRRLIIHDMKYGKGVPVTAEDNPQIRLYALGALNEYGWIYDIEEVEMHIDQPRLASFTTEILSVKELLEWAKEVRKKALLADNDEGEFNPGEHCKFCRVRATCKARANSMLEIIQNIIIGGPKNG